MRCGIVRSVGRSVGHKSTNEAIEKLGCIVYRYRVSRVLCIFQKARYVRFPIVRGRALVETVGRRGGAAQQVYSPRKFLFVCASICEFAMVMRSGRSGLAPSRALTIFFPDCLRVRSFHGLGRGVKVETFRGQNLDALDAYQPRCRSCFIRRARPGHSSSIAAINSSPSGARSLGERRPLSHSLSLSLLLPFRVEKFSTTVHAPQDWHEGSSISIAPPIVKKPCTLHTECPTTQF